MARRCAVMRSAACNWAHRNAAASSPSKPDDPASRQVYLSDSPRMKALRSVPFSRTISARCSSAGSFTSKAPPSPQVMFLVSWKLRQPSDPSVPSARPRQVASKPCAASSITVRRCSAGHGEDAVHVAGDAGIVHRQDGLAARAQRRRDQRLVQVQRVGADVDEHRYRAAQHEGIGGGAEGEGRQDHLVPGTDAGQQRRQFQRRGARRRQQRPVRAEALLQALPAQRGERAVAGQLATVMRLADEFEFLTGQVRAIERQHRSVVIVAAIPGAAQCAARRR